ncbi:MAG TPA: hypothetical protein VF475_14010 [Sphingobium sp.]
MVYEFALFCQRYADLRKRGSGRRESITLKYFAQLRPIERLELSVNAPNLFDTTAVTETLDSSFPSNNVALARTLYGRMISTFARLFSDGRSSITRECATSHLTRLPPAGNGRGLAIQGAGDACAIWSASN